MKNRNPLAVFLLPLVTFGIYGIYWFVKTKGEMNNKGASIPTALLLIVPFVNIWWQWKYAEGVEHVTGGKLSGVLAFILIFLTGTIGAAIIQDSFNKVEDTSQLSSAASAPVPPAGEPAPAPQDTTNTPAAPTIS